ncbi:MAG: dethiobiotin synthase [Thermoguttaceae bacterium]|nr:dethiobiotin synthase [Thermoguttaceae bacterium]MDW8036672.1 dethiobiotin synthase [Thermoguttaceae bacterium]
MVRGLFITGTDTGVGKTYVGAMIARQLAAEGRKVGVYKPVASGCGLDGGKIISEDALLLWQSAGEPGDLEHVCPQRFLAPLAPPVAAQVEGRKVDPHLLRSGLSYWLDRSEIVLVEGVGGLFSPISQEDLVADLAADLGFPLLVVSQNRLGTINHTLLTVRAAELFRVPLRVAGIVLNHPSLPPGDESLQSNPVELARWCPVPLLAQVGYQAQQFDRSVDWFSLAAEPALQ